MLFVARDTFALLFFNKLRVAFTKANSRSDKGEIFLNQILLKSLL